MSSNRRTSQKNKELVSLNGDSYDEVRFMTAVNGNDAEELFRKYNEKKQSRAIRSKTRSLL